MSERNPSQPGPSSDHPESPPIGGAFYKNGRKVGDVLTALPLPPADSTQAAPSGAIVSRARFQLTLAGMFLLGRVGHQDVYEVDSTPASLRIHPLSAQASGRTTKVIVELIP